MFRAGCEVLMRPNVLEVVLKLVSGTPRFTLLKAFRKSLRNCKKVASVKWKFFISPISALKYPGPLMGPCAGQFPKWPGAGSEKPEGLIQSSPPKSAAGWLRPNFTGIPQSGRGPREPVP